MQIWFIHAKPLLFTVVLSHPHISLPNGEDINKHQNNWKIIQPK